MISRKDIMKFQFTATITLCHIFFESKVFGSASSKFNWENVENKLPMSELDRVRRMVLPLAKPLDVLTYIKAEAEVYPHKLVIFPGTKWCGPGDVARTYSDLGFHNKEDRCCREHDHCPRFFATGECKQGLCNSYPFTRSHCHCDMEFRKCLQNVNSVTADSIGTLFFDVNRMKCFREEPPCSPWQGSDEANSTSSEKNRQNCKLKFVDAGRYHPKKLTLRNLIHAKKCFVKKLLPGVSNC